MKSAELMFLDWIGDLMKRAIGFLPRLTSTVFATPIAEPVRHGANVFEIGDVIYLEDRIYKVTNDRLDGQGKRHLSVDEIVFAATSSAKVVH